MMHLESQNWRPSKLIEPYGFILSTVYVTTISAPKSGDHTVGNVYDQCFSAQKLKTFETWKILLLWQLDGILD